MHDCIFGCNIHPCSVTHLVYARFPINMSPQTSLYLFLQLTKEQLIELLRKEADEQEYIYYHCKSHARHFLLSQSYQLS